MELRVRIAGRPYRADLTDARSLAIPLRFDGDQPAFFGAGRASAEPFRAGAFVGDTGQGGSCNVSQIVLVPHCNGTHTENVGHIVATEVPVCASAGLGLTPALLVSVTPERNAARGDLTITANDLNAAIGGRDTGDFGALIVRTLPNTPAKKSVNYDAGNAPAYFDEDAMRLVAEKALRHLLVDLPSIDKMHDGGRLANHRLFWNVAPESRRAGPETRTDRTVTEMIFVDDGVADGIYLLDLQLPAWHGDAAPSNPVVYPLRAVN